MTSAFKRLASGMLAFALALGLMPVMAWTTAAPQAVADEATNGDTVKIDGTADYDKVHEVLAIVNKERAEVGLVPLVLDPKLTDAAMQRAAELALYYDHTRPDGGSCFEVISTDRLGDMGENIAMGQTSAAQVMDGWFYSERELYRNGVTDFPKVGHYLNIINEGYQCIGIGCFYKDGRYFWAQEFSSSPDGVEGVRDGAVPMQREIDVNYDICGGNQAFNVGFDFESKPSLTTSETFEMKYCLQTDSFALDYCEINPFSATWTSSDPKVCTVDRDGVVTGMSLGTAIITATLPSGRSLSHEWTVSEPIDVMYRLYNPNSGEHFYTKEAGERDTLVTLGWDYEGVGWTAPQKSLTPVYRLYSGTDHHYTMDAAECVALEDAGWKYEGIGWYSDDQNRVPLYRQFNPNVDPSAPTNNSGSHNYTTDKSENDSLVQGGWLEEGIGWYGVA